MVTGWLLWVQPSLNVYRGKGGKDRVNSNRGRGITACILLQCLTMKWCQTSGQFILEGVIKERCRDGLLKRQQTTPKHPPVVPKIILPTQADLRHPRDSCEVGTAASLSERHPQGVGGVLSMGHICVSWLCFLLPSARMYHLSGLGWPSALLGSLFTFYHRGFRGALTWLPVSVHSTSWS